MATKRVKESIIDLSKYLDQPVTVKFAGGREVVGVLKGFDQLVNLVLDDCREYIQDVADPERTTDETRYLGLLVCRGTAVTTIGPPGESIANPFAQAAELTDRQPELQSDEQ